MTEQTENLIRVADHLEYFGYINNFDEEENFLKAAHEGYGKLFVREVGRLILHSNYWWISDEASDQDAELLRIINRLNLSSYVSTYSIMSDGGLRIDAVYAGEYNRQDYGEFLDDYHQDIVRAIRSDDELKRYRNREKLALVN